MGIVYGKGNPLFAKAPCQPDDDFKVFADSVNCKGAAPAQVAASLEQPVSAKDAEGPGYDEQCIEASPAHAPGNEGTQILDRLPLRKGSLGKVNAFQLSTFNPASVYRDDVPSADSKLIDCRKTAEKYF